MKKSFSILLSVSALTAITACGGGGATLSAGNPGYISTRVKDNVMRGAFNPSGFTSSQVAKLATQTCSTGKLTGFETLNRDDGLVGFAASCSAWLDDAGAVEFERSGGTGVVIEILGSTNGVIGVRRIDTTL